MIDAAEKPFASTPGRDRAADKPCPFEVARYYYDQRQQIVDDAPQLLRLRQAIDCTGDLALAQWAQWYGVALGFAPELIVELGRGHGNSTALFTQAAWRLGRTKVVSLCRTGDWMSVVAPRIASQVDPAWFANLDARRVDILSADFAAIVGDHRRVLLLWDAHGFEIAELVLGEILPRLADRDHLILMHDISDNRYGTAPRSYEGQPLWKGNKWQQAGDRGSRVNIGWMNSVEDQVVALADFSARNDIEIGSADHELARFFTAHPAYEMDLRQQLGGELFSRIGQWAFLSLSGRAGPFHFPGPSGWRAAANRCAIVSDDLAGPRATITTAAVSWAYAATIAWRPAGAPPPGVPSWIRCRLRVEGAPVGFSLLTADESAFVQSQVASPSERADVVLAVPDLGRHGRLVIHTWDVPAAARVQVEDLSLVW